MHIFDVFRDRPPVQRHLGRYLTIVFVVAILFFAVDIHLTYPRYFIRYELAVEIKVDGEKYEAKSVIEFVYQILPDMLDNIGRCAFNGEMHGYALTLNLGRRGQLYIIDQRPPLMTESRTFLYPDAARLESLPFVANHLQSYGAPSRMRQVLDRVTKIRNAVDVEPRKLPMIVTFSDPKDMYTLTEVDPEHLDKVLGSGARITKATYRPTDDPISPMPPDWPAWLKTSNFDDLTPKDSKHSLMDYVTSIQFKGRAR